MFEWLRNLLANLILDWLFPRGALRCETWGSPDVEHW